MSEEKSRRRTPYPAETRERAIRMVLDHQDEYPSQWAAIRSVAQMLSINRETLRLWVRRAETDEGKRLGHTSVKMTLDIYAHLWPGSEETTRAAIDEAWNEHAVSFSCHNPSSAGDVTPSR